MAQRTKQALADLDSGVVRLPSRRATERTARILREALRDTDLTDAGRDEDIDDLLDATAGNLDHSQDMSVQELPVTQFDVTQLREDLGHDFRLLHDIADLAWAALRVDTKREALRDLLIDVAQDSHGPKIVIFAGSRVTTTDLGRWIEEQIDSNENLARYRGRLTNLGGPTRPSKKQVSHIVAEFAPKTAGESLEPIEKARIEDRYDILIGTDILAEGLNLQQAAILVNYDLPWNPQTLGQRAGRLDRINSPHREVLCYTILPDTGLDLILNLLDRLRRKANIAAATVGVATRLFPDCPLLPRNFATVLHQRAHKSRGKPYIAERHRAWLANALRIPAIRSALDAMPANAIGLARATTGYTFCFNQPTPREAAILCHVQTGTREGHTTCDTLDCLKVAHIPLTAWIKSVRGGADPIGKLTLLPDETLAGLWPRLRRAREQIQVTTPDTHALTGTLSAVLAPQPVTTFT